MSCQYFAYGSNMDASFMASRCPSAKLLSRATLWDYRLTFPQFDGGWGGGVAGVIKEPSAKVEGVLYQISTADLLHLDRLEITHWNFQSGDYRREKVIVHLPEGIKTEAWIYIALEVEGGPFWPTPKYLGKLLAAARDNGLPEDYIQMLLRWRKQL
jgi:gamma-glutamylcyclotransferase (GGCT)/AIG2-like uncharacterized protein YtfP